MEKKGKIDNFNLMERNKGKQDSNSNKYIVE